MQQRFLKVIAGCLLFGSLVGCADSDSNSNKTSPDVEKPVVEQTLPTLKFPPSPMAWVEQVDTPNP